MARGALWRLVGAILVAAHAQAHFRDSGFWEALGDDSAELHGDAQHVRSRLPRLCESDAPIGPASSDPALRYCSPGEAGDWVYLEYEKGGAGLRDRDWADLFDGGFGGAGHPRGRVEMVSKSYQHGQPLWSELRKIPTKLWKLLEVDKSDPNVLQQIDRSYWAHLEKTLRTATTTCCHPGARRSRSL